MNKPCRQPTDLKALRTINGIRQGHECSAFSYCFDAYFQLVVAYSSLNRMDEARAAASEILKKYPNFSVESFAKRVPYKKQADRDLLVNSLRKAGLPE